MIPTALLLSLALCAAPSPAGAGKASVSSLEVLPARVTLDGRHEYAQLLVLGHRDDGSVVDVTRDVQRVEVPASLALDERLLARPVVDGAGSLVLALDDLRVEVPVEVRDQEAAVSPSFVRDVEPRLSRMGCNLGTCHGADKGKNGFKLSLRGYDPAFDHAALIEDLAGRRFDRVTPERSLFLRKPTGDLPHEGGRRVDPASRDFELLREWVASGTRLDLDAPRVTGLRVLPDRPTLDRAGDAQQFRVLARYSDGSERDVTAHAFYESSDIEVGTVDDRGLLSALRRGETALLARYEGQYAATRAVIMGDRDGWTWEAGAPRTWIDELVADKLQRVRSRPSGACTDEEFLRRVHLDLTGLPPTPDDVRTFLLDRRPTTVKRDEEIERLLGSSAFVDHWSNKWCDLLQVNPKYLGEEGARRAREWVRAAVASNQPYDAFVRELLTASGSTAEQPAASWWRVQREPDLAMESTTQLFLGVRFNCNKCHDHPFERWTQDQHWELAAFLAQVAREPVAGAVDAEAVRDADMGAVTNPRSGAEAPPRFPFEHAGEVPAVGEAPRRVRFAAWMTAPENPYFARSYVNRLWSYFLGKGLIEPVDDIRASNPPSNPALLDRLTAEFVASGFDVRAAMRAICRSDTYQRSVATNEWNADDDLNYAHALARRLPAEVLYDALHQATGARRRLPGQRPGARAAALSDPAIETRDGFLALFGRPARESACECERAGGVSLGQALSLVNGPTVAEAIQDPQNGLVELARYERDPARLAEELSLAFLCRRPTDEERAVLTPALDARDPANLVALDADGLTAVERARDAFEAAVPLPAWGAVQVLSARSSGGAELSVQDDGSVRAAGPRPERDTTTLVVWSPLDRLTGLRIETLPDPELPAGGPGRAENGNFVLTHVAAVLVPATAPEAGGPLAFGRPTADFSQAGWDVAGLVDGDAGTGWAVMPGFGVRHEAVLPLATPRETPGGATLVLTLEQPFGQAHTLGRVRITATDSPEPRATAVPDAVLAVLRTPTEERTPEQRDVLLREVLARDEPLRDRVRLAVVRDAAWALANSPAFLFNR